MGACGFHQEEAVERMMTAGLKANKNFSREQAEIEVYGYANSEEGELEALAQIKRLRRSGIVSRTTQLATLKGMVLDYENGVYKKGLTALTVLKAMELLNKMNGYEAPEVHEHKHEHEHEIVTFPVVEQPFKGELEPLQVTDMDENVRAKRNETMTQTQTNTDHTQTTEIIDIEPSSPSEGLTMEDDW